MNEFFEYLNRLRPEQRKVIKAAWRVSLVGMEREFPKLLGWTRYHRIPRLISAGVYVTHPEFDEQHLIALIRGEVRESEFFEYPGSRTRASWCRASTLGEVVAR